MQTNDVETAKQIAAVNSVVPDLERLEGLVADERGTKITALKRFTASTDLARLIELHEELLAQVDIFQVLGVGSSELHHSRFLAWLLDPHQTHGLGDYFLKSFLFQTCTKAVEAGLPCVAPSRIHTIDWSGTEVLLERDRIDIRVLNRKARVVCAVENKIWAPEGIGEDEVSQLYGYRTRLEELFPGYEMHYVFLSPTGMSPRNESDREHWTVENYSTVLKIMEQTAEHTGTSFNEDARALLRQYAMTLRRNKIVLDANTELQQLVRKIYLEHRQAIELIIQHKPDIRAEAKDIFREAIAGISGSRLDCEDQNFLRFQPSAWDSFEVQKTGTGWLGQDSSALLLFQINFRDGISNLPYLDLGLSPCPDERIRRKLLDGANQNQTLFRPIDGGYRSGWIVLDAKEYILEESDYARWDDPYVCSKIEAWVKNFAENEFPAMNKVIVNCLREYEAETKNQ